MNLSKLNLNAASGAEILMNVKSYRNPNNNFIRLFINDASQSTKIVSQFFNSKIGFGVSLCQDKSPRPVVFITSHAR